MAGTYAIIENKSDAYKFRAMVSFNDKNPEYWEHDSLEAKTINEALQLTADADAEQMIAKSIVPDLTVVDGKLVE